MECGVRGCDICMGLVDVQRWTGNEAKHLSIVIAAYDCFMNAVDLVKQLILKSLVSLLQFSLKV